MLLVITVQSTRCQWIELPDVCQLLQLWFQTISTILTSHDNNKSMCTDVTCWHLFASCNPTTLNKTNMSLYIQCLDTILLEQTDMIRLEDLHVDVWMQVLPVYIRQRFAEVEERNWSLLEEEIMMVTPSFPGEWQKEWHSPVTPQREVIGPTLKWHKSLTQLTEIQYYLQYTAATKEMYIQNRKLIYMTVFAFL